MASPPPTAPARQAPEPAGTLAGLTLDLVGTGRVGASLGAWAVAAGARVARVAAATPASAAAAAGRWGAETVAVDELAGSGSDLLLLAVPDGALAAVAARLAERPQAPVALHTAGRFGAEPLAPLAGRGAATGTLHPLKAFPRPLPAPTEAHGVFFAVDGAPAARDLAHRLAIAWGGEPGLVPAPARPLYHLAATLAAGGVASLVASAAALARELGLPDAVGRGYLELARGALAAAGSAAGEGELEAAITGPLARGETAVFLEELAALAARPGGDRRLPLFAALGVETVRLTAGGEAAVELARRLAAAGLGKPPAPGGGS